MRVSIYLPREVHRAAKIDAANAGQPLTATLGAIIAGELTGQPIPRPARRVRCTGSETVRPTLVLDEALAAKAGRGDAPLPTSLAGIIVAHYCGT
jgi:hypothetical protein